MLEDDEARNRTEAAIRRFQLKHGRTPDEVDAFLRARDVSKRYEEQHGPPPRLSYPICGIPTLISLYLPEGRTLAELRGVIPAEEAEGEIHITFGCPEGHRWRMRGRYVEGATIWERWEPLETAS
jgi:hypothetical protein